MNNEGTNALVDDIIAEDEVGREKLMQCVMLFPLELMSVVANGKGRNNFAIRRGLEHMMEAMRQ